ncbi:OLC1v1015782C1 [Oldenlandia corymbosa var. corymbosa]|nr:OLC1v1015782C1 [Oldenlandia corymbosa var. corymbosa]
MAKKIKTTTTTVLQPRSSDAMKKQGNVIGKKDDYQSMTKFVWKRQPTKPGSEKQGKVVGEKVAAKILAQKLSESEKQGNVIEKKTKVEIPVDQTSSPETNNKIRDKIREVIRLMENKRKQQRQGRTHAEA